MTEDFDWLTLEADEEIRWSGKPHAISMTGGIVVGLVLSVFVIGLFLIAATWLSRENTAYVVTNKALYRKTGILSRDVKRIEFEKVQNTSISQGVLGAQFGYGTVGIATAGSSGTEMEYRSVPEPGEVQDLINHRIHEVKTGEGGPEADGPDAVLEEILEELRRIRTALDDGEPADVPVTGETAGTSPEASASGTSPARRSGDAVAGEPAGGDSDSTSSREPTEDGTAPADRTPGDTAPADRTPGETPPADRSAERKRDERPAEDTPGHDDR